MAKLRGLFLIIFLILIGVSYFNMNSYKSVDSIQSEVLQAPVETPIVNGEPIKFIKDGYNYTLTPIYDYTLNGLVLHQQKYDAWYSISRTDKTFIKDICAIWGNTLKDGSYRDGSVSVTQDSRWCWWSYTNSNLIFNPNEISNNHLIASSPSVERQILSIDGGDQIRIIGKLVNVHAEAIGKTSQYENGAADWHTSTTRDDTGAGACEIIYVESIEILQKGNEIFHLLFSIGWYGLLVCLFWIIIEFFVNTTRLSSIGKN